VQKVTRSWAIYRRLYGDFADAASVADGADRVASGAN
jgi:hypothetical protein